MKNKITYDNIRHLLKLEVGNKVMVPLKISDDDDGLRAKFKLVRAVIEAVYPYHIQVRLKGRLTSFTYGQMYCIWSGLKDD